MDLFVLYYCLWLQLMPWMKRFFEYLMYVTLQYYEADTVDTLLSSRSRIVEISVHSTFVTRNAFVYASCMHLHEMPRI